MTRLFRDIRSAEESERAVRKLQAAQIAHWSNAVRRLSDLDEIASPEGWASLERQTGAVLRDAIRRSLRELTARADGLRDSHAAMPTGAVAAAIQGLRGDYLRTDTMLDFFGDAINSRSSSETAALLSALDQMAGQSMREVLEPLGHTTPPVITYLDKGLGASILKANLRLWDRRSISPAAAIKVVRHNILTPTALLHETGHQVAHITAWNGELSEAISSAGLGRVGSIWASWASEIAADAFAFAYAGYASTAALTNVVDGGASRVFRFVPGDPHPLGFLRVLLGTRMAARAFGSKGPWRDLENYWLQAYPASKAPVPTRDLVVTSLPLLGRIAEIVNDRRYRAFGGRALSDVVPFGRVSPDVLDRFERSAGPRAFASPYVVRRESIRLVALSGLRMAQNPAVADDYFERQRTALRTLGAEVLAA